MPVQPFTDNLDLKRLKPQLIPKEHPAAVYVNPKYRTANLKSVDKKKYDKKGIQSLSNLRNPFVKWKPSINSKRMKRALQEV